MIDFDSKALPVDPTVTAPDGSNVRVLLGLRGGGLAQFELPAGKVSHAVVHTTVEEIWYVISGRGEMWRKQSGREEIIELSAGLSLTIPLDTHFQFRAFAENALVAVGVTMPPWPGDHEAKLVKGPWAPSTA